MSQSVSYEFLAQHHVWKSIGITHVPIGLPFDHHTTKPSWLDLYNWTWVEESELSKLLGTFLDSISKLRMWINFLLIKSLKKYTRLLEHDETQSCKQGIFHQPNVILYIFGSSSLFGEVREKHSRKFIVSLGTTILFLKRQRVHKRVTWNDYCKKRN